MNVVVIRGEAYVTLRAAAECFAVEVAWVEEVHAHGLLGPAEPAEGELAIAARMLDRLADVLRFHRYHGLDLERIALIFV